MKIKITEKEKIIEGKLEKGRVTPFGTSGHIISQKKHIGKQVNILIPDDTIYEWILSQGELKKLIDMGTKILNEKVESKHDFHLRNSLANVWSGSFKIVDLNKLVEIIGENELTRKIKKIYQL